MAVDAVQNTGYVQVLDNNTGNVYNLPAEEVNASVFMNDNNGQYFASKQLDINVDSVDGSSDGKLSFGEHVKQAWKGIGDMISAPITEAAKGNFAPLIGTAVGAVVIGGAVAVIGAPALVAAGVVGGIFAGAKLIGGIVKSINADTDAEAKAASREIGQGSFGVLVSTAGVKGGLKSMKADVDSNYGQLGKDATFGDKTRAYFKDLGNSTRDAAQKVNPFRGRGGKPETVPEEGINEEQLIKDIMNNTDEPTVLTQEQLARINAIDADDALVQMQEAQVQLV